MLNAVDTAQTTPVAAEVQSWNLGALFSSIREWKKEADQLEDLHSKSWPPLPRTIQGVEDPSRIAEILKHHFEFRRRLEALYTYAERWRDEDMRVGDAKEAADRAQRLWFLYEESIAWLEPEIIRLPDTAWARLRAAACMQPFEQWMRVLQRQREHTLSPEEEALLAMASQPLATSQRAFSALNNVDLQFASVEDSEGQVREVTHALFGLYQRSPDRLLRERSWHSVRSAYASYQHTIAELFKGNLEAASFAARARRYGGVLESHLDPQGIPTELYKNSIAAVHRHLPTLHRYFSLKKKMLQLDRLHPWDLYAPLCGEVIDQIPYEKAVEWVVASVAPLGEEYQKRVHAGLTTERWVHPFEQPGKRSGAYMGGGYDGLPYILMNYRGDLQSVFTLAHEVGHAMHNELSNASNPYWNAGYSIFVAEIASTFNEQLLHDFLEKEIHHPLAAPYLLQERIESAYQTMIRQILYAEWELWVHEAAQQGEPLSADRLSGKWADLCRTYHGPEWTEHPLVGIEWSRIPHFYSPFYVYQYATGLASAIFLYDQLRKEGTAARQPYLQFLAAGGSKDPLELLDMAHVPLREGEAIDQALTCMEEWVSALEDALALQESAGD